MNILFISNRGIPDIIETVDRISTCISYSKQFDFVWLILHILSSFLFTQAIPLRNQVGLGQFGTTVSEKKY